MMKKLFTEEFDEAKVREAYQQMEAERDAERGKDARRSFCSSMSN